MGRAIAVACRGLTKRYRVASPGGRRTIGVRRKEDFFALKDVTFEVETGAVVGIVGRNGAGKSTLLKVLSRIVEPTAGEATIRGRLAGLLEVGTGFHPELTGRENIFLNGTIMGMSRKDVRAEFDSIVDFAGIDYFLETPVKRYSSGMYVRLAFAVAAHLRSDILVLDEVLAVGDAAFQQKCLDKVRDLTHDQGRTVLIVSHNAEVIRQNADWALRLEQGRISMIGSVESVLAEGIARDNPTNADVSTADRVDGNWGEAARILSIQIAGDGTIKFGGDLNYRISVKVNRVLSLGVGQAVITLDDIPVAASFSEPQQVRQGLYLVDVVVPRLQVAPGRYALNVVIGQSSFAAADLHVDGVMHAASFEVLPPANTVMEWHPEWWGHLPLATPTTTFTSG